MLLLQKTKRIRYRKKRIIDFIFKGTFTIFTTKKKQVDLYDC